MKRNKHLLFFFLDDLLTILVSPAVMESGRLWNYLRGKHNGHMLKIVPLQFIDWFVFVTIGFYDREAAIGAKIR